MEKIKKQPAFNSTDELKQVALPPWATYKIGNLLRVARQNWPMNLRV